MLSNNGKQAEIKNVHMYVLCSTNGFYDGMKFDSLALAVDKCRQAITKGYTTDIKNLSTGSIIQSHMNDKTLSK